MKKSSLALIALFVTASAFADEAKTEALLTLASADTSAAVSVQATKEDNSFAADTEQEAKFFGRLLSAKIAAELPEKVAKEAAVNVKF